MGVEGFVKETVRYKIYLGHYVGCSGERGDGTFVGLRTPMRSVSALYSRARPPAQARHMQSKCYVVHHIEVDELLSGRGEGMT